MKAIQNLGFKTVAMALREDSYSIDDPELLAQGKNLRLFLVQKETAWHPRLLRTVIIRLRFPWLMVWILLMWQLQVLWHSGNWVGNDS